MSMIDSLHTLLAEELLDLYGAERRLATAMPGLICAATDVALAAVLKAHHDETRAHLARLEESLAHLGVTPTPGACAGVEGIITDAETRLGADFATDALRDAMIVGAAQRIAHHAIAGYGTAAAHARQLGLAPIVSVLVRTLGEEQRADRALTRLAEAVINPNAVIWEERRVTDAQLSGLLV